MVVRRKEQKAYGTGKMVEGEFSSGASCVIIEDVISTGSSILETAKVGNSFFVTAEKYISWYWQLAQLWVGLLGPGKIYLPT